MGFVKEGEATCLCPLQGHCVDGKQCPKGEHVQAAGCRPGFSYTVTYPEDSARFTCTRARKRCGEVPAPPNLKTGDTSQCSWNQTCCMKHEPNDKAVVDCPNIKDTCKDVTVCDE